MYRALAATRDGPILELAVGTGRIAVPLAAAGHHVTGVDRDPHVLHRARRKWAAHSEAMPGRLLELVEADITDAELPLGEPTGRFGLVILALNTLLLISPREAQAAVLRNMALHLSPHGRAVVDVWLPRDDDLALYDGRTTLDWVRTDQETGERVSKSTSAIHDATTKSATITTTFEAWRDDEPVATTVRRDDVLFIGPEDLLALAGSCGLTAEAIYGDHAMGDFAPDSERIVLVCRSKGR